MKRVLVFFLILTTFWSCQIQNGKSLIENGVSLSLAENRKERLSLINYKLDFRIPSVYDQKIQGLEELTFNLEGANEDLLLDFRESVDMLKGLIINGKSQEILF